MANRVAEVDGRNRLLLSNCPACDKTHETPLHTAEVKYHHEGYLYPFWSDCPNEKDSTLLVRYDSASATVGIKVMRRTGLHALKPPGPGPAQPLNTDK